MHLADVQLQARLKPSRPPGVLLGIARRRATAIRMRTIWLKKRVFREALDEQALARSIDGLEDALRVRSRALRKLRRERGAPPRRAVKISYTLPIESN
jgi:hypothetical protein